MTNFVFSVNNCMTSAETAEGDTDSSSGQPERLLLRVYGKSDWMFERKLEEETALVLAKHGILPRWFGVFRNGRFEDFIPSIPLTAAMIRNIPVAIAIANQLRRIHDMLPEVVRATSFKSCDYMLDRLELWREAAVVAFQRLQALDLAVNYQRILKSIDSSNVLDPSTVSGLVAAAKKSPSPIVFGHCDLHHANVLENTTSGALVVIDFEYGIPTFRGFDFANVLSEFCYDYDSSRPETPDVSKYPSKGMIQRLAKEYLGSGAKDQEVDQLVEEIALFRPLVQIIWGHWSLIKAADKFESRGVIRYDYLKAAEARYESFSCWV